MILCFVPHVNIPSFYLIKRIKRSNIEKKLSKSLIQKNSEDKDKYTNSLILME